MDNDHIRATASIQRCFPLIDAEVVGFEDDTESIIRQLTGGTRELDIVSIVGMPGLGKTTLAGKVFNHFIDNKHFDVRAWCSISKEYSLRNAFSDILKQAIGSIDGIRDEDMADKLRRSLMRKRYLIVLDDIWEVKVWEELQLSFPQDENGSRIMVTTRDEELARQLKHHSNPYFLQFLPVDKSWELLRKKVFQGEICPPELLQAGLQVAKNCKGLPLVIVLIAGVIAKQRQASLWHKAAKDLSSHVLEEQSMKIIESSYDHLEDHLKACVLYMGLFPEDCKIPVSDLLKLWIAENFVLNMDKENLEEASKICLNDLVNRSLVMISKRRANGEINYCTLHDVVREFCVRKLTKEKSMQVIVPYNPYQPSYAKEPRLCMYIHEGLFEKSVYNTISVLGLKEEESFAQYHSSFEFIAHPEFFSRVEVSLFPFHAYRLIRVLNLLDIYSAIEWVEAVNTVTHLRYLAIRTEEFDFQWVSHLLDLQTLRVVQEKNEQKHLKTSPAFWKMKKLRHVDISDFSFTWEDSDRGIFEESSEAVLPNLKTFGKCRIVLADMTPEFWGRFPNIKQLKLHFVEPQVEYPPDTLATQEIDKPILEELPLQSLQVSFSQMTACHESFGWGSWFIFPSNLKDLYIHGINLSKKLVSNIARLQNLDRLKLSVIFFKGEDNINGIGYSKCWDVSDNKFQALKFLKLKSVFITEWRSSEASFPVLEKLVLKNCSFQEIPSSFAEILTLESIKLNRCTKSLVDSALNIKREVEDITGCDVLQVHSRYMR